MLFDISLPLAVSLITAAVLFIHIKLGGRIKSLLGEKEFTTRDAILLVVMMGAMVTILGWTAITIPDLVIVVFFLYAYSTVLFLFTYLIVPKWYVAIISPLLFAALYLLFRETYIWSDFLMNPFAVIFAICVSVYIGGLFTWKTTAVFVILLTIMDVIQVFITGFMVGSSERMMALQLPVMIIVPAFPVEGYSGLGLGDIFLSALLTIQIGEKYGKKWGFASIIAIGAVFLILWTAIINSELRYFPATVVVICGWLTALGARYLYESSFPGAE